MTRTSYRKTIDYLYSRLPMYHRIGPAAYKTDLTNTLRLCEMLEHPEKQFRSIHVAGTNGKGSVSHLLAAVLQRAGYKTGLFTSPHLKDFRERIRINGQMIPRHEVVSFVSQWESKLEQIRPSFFEWTVGLAFNWFAREKVDIAVIETGMGGRLDSTNVITPLLCVITNIGYDHMAFLGTTLPEIAAEKAGIIKPGVPVVIGESNPETLPVFEKTALFNQSPLIVADQKFRVVFNNKVMAGKDGMQYLYNVSGWSRGEGLDELMCPLGGVYQQQNLATVLAALQMLGEIGIKEISGQLIKEGIADVIKLTRLQGRWQILRKRPLVIADVAHNEHGLRRVLPQLQELNYKNLHIVLGMVSDKDYHSLLALFPVNASYYFCRPDIPRGLDAAELARAASACGLSGKIYPSVRQAYHSAIANSGNRDLVFVGGSTFVVAEVL